MLKLIGKFVLENLIRVVNCSFQLKLLEKAVANEVNFVETPDKFSVTKNRRKIYAK